MASKARARSRKKPTKKPAKTIAKENKAKQAMTSNQAYTGSNKNKVDTSAYKKAASTGYMGAGYTPPEDRIKISEQKMIKKMKMILQLTLKMMIN